ncbi:hypothetical protein CJ010_03980 [Azoarcus sp. DD4]|uniref:hemin uptake protein HemP n=1 Tax=Azoarcus sp. DD4 TaxID=2027405 RepID=UPI00112C4C03|nr:hemin uptake protein HemP [Azoarcus sp. DD4]QDF95769.1 hypothetical protein CJ010_03980 [Azoarcus sp. DD4]
MTIETSDQSATRASADAPGSKLAGSPADESGLAIPSAQLLGGRSCVTIDHQGVNYVLRATRAGKLILTK